MNKPRTVHPFPARMAPELALDVLSALKPGSLVVDPMCGSGTVLRYAQDLGLNAVGVDVDPLAVLMAKVWTQRVTSEAVESEMRTAVEKARALNPTTTHLPWIDTDDETRSFVDYWFAGPQTRDLRRLAKVLRGLKGKNADLLRLALSKTIVTKERGASLARDTSHSRPHRVADTNEYKVFEGFQRATVQILRALREMPQGGSARVLLEDARVLCGIRSESVDCVLMSPPYLNAIDYLRGHKLALVWLGYQIGEIREIRSGSVGAERRLVESSEADGISKVRDSFDWYPSLSPRFQGVFDRYLYDLHRVLGQVSRILRPGKEAVFVIGNSTVRGTYVENSEALKRLASLRQLVLAEERQREIPPSSRYLPPPARSGSGSLSKRMRKEVILRFRRQA